MRPPTLLGPSHCQRGEVFSPVTKRPASVLKLGKRLVVLEVTVHSAGHAEPVAHATGTYSIPPKRAQHAVK